MKRSLKTSTHKGTHLPLDEMEDSDPEHAENRIHGERKKCELRQALNQKQKQT